MKTQIITNEKKGTVVILMKNRKYQGKGIARCNASHNDIFVESTGIELAEQRALKSMEQARRRAYAKNAKMHLANAKHYQEMMATSNDNIAAIDAKIATILESVN